MGKEIRGGGPSPGAAKLYEDVKAKRTGLTQAQKKLQTARMKVRDVKKQIDSYEDYGSKFKELDDLRSKRSDAKKTMDAAPRDQQMKHESDEQFAARKKRQDMDIRMFGQTSEERDYKHAGDDYQRVRSTFVDPHGLRDKLKEAKKGEKTAGKELDIAASDLKKAAKKYSPVAKAEGRERAKELEAHADHLKGRANLMKIPGQPALEIKEVKTHEREFGKMHGKTVTKQVYMTGTKRFQTDEMKTKMQAALKEKASLEDEAYSAQKEAERTRLGTSRWKRDEMHDIKVIKKKAKD
jgi:hypothetical protein